jgi:hypothetical protein
MRQLLGRIKASTQILAITFVEGWIMETTIKARADIDARLRDYAATHSLVKDASMCSSCVSKTLSRTSADVESLCQYGSEIANIARRAEAIALLRPADDPEKAFVSERSRLSSLRLADIVPEIALIEHEIFVANACNFTIMMTGQLIPGDVTLPACISKLSSAGAARREQFRPIYDEMQRLRSDIEKQRKTLTCIEYRRVLESLPDETRHKAGSATKRWQAAWKDMVEAELRKLVQNSPRSLEFQPGPLTDLLQHDFEFWRKRNQKAATSVPTTEYETWSGYRRGYDLYGELSANIHQFDSTLRLPFEIREEN